MQKNEYNEKSFSLTLKAAHSRNLCGVTPHSPNTFLTSSEDASVRLWDLRTCSSVKLFRSQNLSEEITNPETNGENGVFVGSSSNLYAFDCRKQQIFIEEIKTKIEQPHYDVLNKIKARKDKNQILCCDDEGDIRTYDMTTFSCLSRMEQQHTNICNAVDFAFSDNKQFINLELCASGGFDSTLIVWDMKEEKVIKKIPLQQIFTKYQIKSDNQNFPFIYALCSYKNFILIGTETGHILCHPVHDLRRPKFILQASLGKIVDTKIWNPFNKPILVTADNTDSFCLFNFEQRKDGLPIFLSKYKTKGQPIDMAMIKTNILVASEDPAIGIYTLK